MSDSEPLLTVARANIRLDTLVSLRNRLAEQIDGTDSGRDVAALSLRLVDVLEQIDRLSAGAKAKGTALDELAARRAARKTPARPGRAKVKP